MRRYRFLEKEEVYSALNRLRDAFLAAKDGIEVDEIINGLLTQDEKLKIGRRILIAELIRSDVGIDQISRSLKVGKNTILSVMKSIDLHPESFELIGKRLSKVEKEYRRGKIRLIGGSELVFKRKEYTGLKRKDIKR